MTFSVHGRGPALLCLSGFGCSSWIFDDLRSYLSPFRSMILVENRGMGSNPGVREPYSLEDLAEDALHALDQCQFQACDVLGVSMGGFLAQILACHYPSRIERLILAGPTGNGPNFVPLPETGMLELSRFYRQSGSQQALQSIPLTTHPRFANEQPDRYQVLLQKRAAMSPDLDQMRLQYEAVEKWLKGPELDLGQIVCPSLILHGAEDRYVSPCNAKRLAQTIPNVELVFIPNSDHFFFYEQVDLFSKAIIDFWGAPCPSV